MRRALAAASVVLGLALTACGGGSGGTPNPAATSGATTTTDSAPANAQLGGTFARASTLPPTVSCTYPSAGQAAKPNSAPPTRGVSAQGGGGDHDGHVRR